jgi:hypothetical protein
MVKIGVKNESGKYLEMERVIIKNPLLTAAC